MRSSCYVLVFSRVATHAGLTWYELYLLAVAHTLQPVDAVTSSTAAAAKTIAMQIRTFAMETSSFVRFLLTPDSQMLFHASSSTHNRMHAYGFENRPQHTCLVPHLHADIASALNVTMLDLTHQLSNTQKRSLADGNLQVKVHSFKGAGSFRCAPQLQMLSECMRSLGARTLVLWPVTIPDSGISVPLGTRSLRVCHFLS